MLKFIKFVINEYDWVGLFCIWFVINAAIAIIGALFALIVFAPKCLLALILGILMLAGFLGVVIVPIVLYNFYEEYKYRKKHD